VPGFEVEACCFHRLTLAKPSRLPDLGARQGSVLVRGAIGFSPGSLAFPPVRFAVSVEVILLLGRGADYYGANR
jgi:hypothetical protein